MLDKSFADCSKGSILQYFLPALSYHLSLRPLFCLFWGGRLRQVYCIHIYLKYGGFCLCLFTQLPAGDNVPSSTDNLRKQFGLRYQFQHMAFHSQHMAFQLLAFHSQHMALHSQHMALHSQHMALHCQHMALHSQPMALYSQHMALHCQHSITQSTHGISQSAHGISVNTWHYTVNTALHSQHMAFQPTHGITLPIHGITLSTHGITQSTHQGAQWLSGRMLDSRPKGCGFEPHRHHCVVVLEQDTFILALYWFNPGRSIPI